MRNVCILLIGIGLISILIQPVQAQTEPTLTVEESVQLGLEHSYRLEAAHANTEEAEAVYRQAKTGRFPTIQAQASYMRLSDNIPEVDFAVPGTDTSYTFLPVELDQFHSEVSLQQLLFAGGRLNNQVEAAEYQANAAGLMEQKERVEVAFNIRQAYWQLYSARAVNETIESALVQVKEHLQNVKNKVEAGTALRIDLLNAKTRHSEIQLKQVESKNNVHVALLELNRLLGLPPQTRAELVSPHISEALPFTMNRLMSRALNQRPELQALSARIGAREARVDAIQGKWFPEISLVGRYIYARPNQYFFTERDEFKGTWEAGVTLQWNIWSGGQRSTQTSQAKARLHNVEARLAHQREQARVEVTKQYLELERAQKAIEVAATGVDAAKEAFQTARQQFKAGVVLSEKVLDAQQAYQKAQARHARAIADYQIAHAAIMNALGQIWEDKDGE